MVSLPGNQAGKMGRIMVITCLYLLFTTFLPSDSYVYHGTGLKGEQELSTIVEEKHLVLSS